MNNREYKKALKTLHQSTFLRPPEGGRDRLLEQLSDRRAGITVNSAASARKIREFRFVSQFKYALAAMLLIIGLFNTAYLVQGRKNAFEQQEKSLAASRIIDELIIDTPFAEELRHTAKMYIKERGKTDEI